MKLDRDSSENCTNSTVIGKEVHAASSADEFCCVHHQLATHCFGEAFSYQTEFGKVKNIRIKDIFRRFPLKLFVLGAFKAVRITIRQTGQNLSLQFPIKSHMPGFRDNRFEWNQNDSTAWPCTHLRPG